MISMMTMTQGVQAQNAQIAGSVQALAGEKSLTLEDLNFGGRNYRNMSVKNRSCTWWGNQLVRRTGDTNFLIDKNSGKESKLFTTDDLNQWLNLPETQKIGSVGSASYPYADKNIVVIYSGSRRYTIDFKKHTLLYMHELNAGEQMLETSDASNAVAYLKDNNLYVASGKSVWKLSEDGSRDIVYGQSVHRDEFGISKGTFWNASGTKLAFYRMDQSMVTDYPQVNIPEIGYDCPETKSRIATAAPDKYPMAGEISHKVTVGIFDITTGKTTYLKTGDPTDRYFTNIAWNPDGKTVYMFELNRDQNDCRLTSYDAESGQKTGELYRETDDKYVEPQHPIVFLPWDSNRFIMQSRKDGYNHLYLCSLKHSGGKNSKQPALTDIRQLTSGEWEVFDIIGFNIKNKSVIIASNECCPIQKNIFTVDCASGKRTLADANGKGWHNALPSSNGQYILDNYSTPDTPRNIEIINIDNHKHTAYFKADNPWNGYKVPEYSCGTVKAADGKTDLYWRMVKPVGFDPGKKYPAIVYVYGGPHAHNVEASWHYGSRSWETYMADKGYLLFILDNRGSEHRGKAFEQVTFRQLGQEEMKDQMQGVEYLKSLPYVDADKIGVHGWSYGGFMTISLMTNYPDVFKVGVAGGPVIDWHWYEVMYGERYMDTPKANPDGYKNTSLLYKAGNLKGKLQIITGYNDPTVVPQHCLTFLKACIAAGTQPDFFVYPGEPHNMRGHQSTHLHERISQYFFDYLK